MNQIVKTEKAPGAIGPYSQAVIHGGLVFTSGQIPIDPATGAVVSGGITEQATQVMKNLAAILEAAGTSLDNAVKATCFLADIGDFQKFNEVYASFIKNTPARSCFAVKDLPRGVLVEVELIAGL